MTLRTPVIKTIEARNIAALIDAVKECLDRFGTHELWFRGHCSIRWRLQATVHRKAHPTGERSLFLLFRAGAYSRHPNPPRPDDTSQWLCLMRHYGLPTRLLDWTRSVLIAAHFALRERPFKTPCIWVLVPSQLNLRFGTSTGSLTLRDDTSDERLQKQLVDVNADSSQEDSVLAVLPPEIDLRLLIQRSTFTIHGSPEPLQELKKARRCLACIRIPRDAAAAMARSLAALDISDVSLFPDLEHLAQHLASD